MVPLVNDRERNHPVLFHPETVAPRPLCIPKGSHSSWLQHRFGSAPSPLNLSIPLQADPTQGICSGGTTFPRRRRLHALAHRRSICHLPSAIRHPPRDPPVERGSPTLHYFCFVFGRNILYMQMHCHGHCFIAAIPSRGNVSCAHGCRSSAKPLGASFIPSPSLLYSSSGD